MTTPTPDDRSPQRRERDERIASEPQLAPPDLPPGTGTSPVEDFAAHPYMRVLRSAY